ncbi:hypothetical protein VIBNISOn1_530005 [Vibrio nigripulchritudo SOn1]|uniref:DNA replication terminus site-binding protein n=1 Tax=Vibrio nigripulchritudo SOn1 TaxID=1238450 RepID=A0AAV2VUP4_9VIBR|nr:DNA replication terminus site-binding protein [Vibrio nigripulchritudo]CCO48436.1 hypothetical protein VIBNISOn1_530005 [Vibrio nigripulchritudo SOn1]
MEKTSTNDSSRNTEITPEFIYDRIFGLRDQIENLISLLKNCKRHHCDVAYLPRCFVDSEGKDTVFDSVDEILLERSSGDTAFEYYLTQLRFQPRHEKSPSKDLAISQIAARRTVGVIHLHEVVAGRKDEIHQLVEDINQMKKRIGNDLASIYPDPMHRSRNFYRKYLPDIVPKSITRLIQIAPSNTSRVHFSWLVNGYTQKIINRDEVVRLIHSANNKIALANPDLRVNVLNSRDESKLGNIDKFYRLIPSKVNPRYRVTVEGEGKPKQLQPVRAVIPLLIMQNEDLKEYRQLAELHTLQGTQRNRNKKRVNRKPILEALQIFECDTSD